MAIKTLVLGAGQEVGKSCVVVTFGGKTIMFDCGMHMGYSDERRFPDFSLISKTGNFTQAIDCIIITHFHLDHVGALPYFTEVCGYEGPIYMTYPTKALAPLMLEDYRKVMVDRRGEQEQFSVLQIHQCMKKVTAVDLRQIVNLGDLHLQAYYAGHVLGAAMFYVKVGDNSVLYTGDYSMTPDRHLGAAHVDRLQPDVIITESTYATTIRDSKHAREREFLKAVHTCVTAGGKVLIPVFALGRAQELCILLDEYWERVNLKVPIYFSAGLTMQANVYYKLLISWTNQKVKDTYVTRNTFDFKHVSSFERSQIDVPGPCVLFATPGMLSGGLSLEVFKHWAPSEHNMVVVPGYCVAGTVGHKLMSGKPTKIDLDKRTQLDVRCQVHHLSFSAHTDAKGIMDLLKHVQPRHVILVHGEKPKMSLLKSKISTDLGIPCFNPANNETVEIPSHFIVKVQATKQFLTNSPDLGGAHRLVMNNKLKKGAFGKLPHVSEISHLEGILMMDQARKIKVMHPTEAPAELGIKEHKLAFSCHCHLYLNPNELKLVLESSEADYLQRNMKMNSTQDLEGSARPKEKDLIKVEPVKKKYRMDLQRILSLDLEREPIMDEAEEISNANLSVKECASGKISEYDGFHKQFRDSGNGPQKTLNLDINVIPHLPTSKKNCTESTKEAKTVSFSSSQILHAVYEGLVQWLGNSVLEEREDCIKGRSFCIHVFCDCVSSKEDFTEKNSAVVLTCKWFYEDEKLANKVISLLRTMRFKLE